MKIAILGAGFGGLSAAYTLLKLGQQVVLIEKDTQVGGLAVGFKQPNWNWSLEKAYHHWFTNDEFVLGLAKEIGHKVIIKRPTTKVMIDGLLYPLDSPLSLLGLPRLSLIDKLRMGLTLSYLKISNNYRNFESIKALPWLEKTMGKNATNLIWQPLFQGKFSNYKDDISLSWFWARIKKRTPSLAYPDGGFQLFAEHLLTEIKKLGGEVLLNSKVLKITNKDHTNLSILLNKVPKTIIVDKVICTLPSPIFSKITPGLPADYSKKICSISHLHAQVLILCLNQPFLKDTYWLNITEKNWPFLVLAEHTNFMDKVFYNNQHIIYVGNYLPTNHPYLKLSAKELLEIFDPYLNKLKPDYKQTITDCFLFSAPFAQPVVTVGYKKNLSNFKTPLDNIYLANMDMVYPWDRGTNYAVEMGQKVADLVHHET